ncbi:hypothetical protein [Streptomyces sp. NPDC008317]|uniref:hypothetical protein n=1 Tax=Streptomyces sp. NPDC008317 TaxID=3364827 RepID=UPI0036EEEEAC
MGYGEAVETARSGASPVSAGHAPAAGHGYGPAAGYGHGPGSAYGRPRPRGAAHVSAHVSAYGRLPGQVRVHRPATAYDHGWRAGFRVAVGVAGGLLAALTAADWALGTLDPVRAAFWTALAAAVFGALCPPLVTAGDGWLRVRGMLRGHRVRTDRLVRIHLFPGRTPRLVLIDAEGGRAAFDPRVLAANPGLWRLLEAGGRRSYGRGLLVAGLPVLDGLAAEAAGGAGREPGPESGAEPGLESGAESGAESGRVPGPGSGGGPGRSGRG